MKSLQYFRSYLCMDSGTESLIAELHSSTEKGGDPGEKLANATLTAKLVHFDAFRPSSLPEGQYQTPSDCSYRPNDVVPIIVGCALAGMVVMVNIYQSLSKLNFLLYSGSGGLHGWQVPVQGQGIHECLIPSSLLS